MVVLCGKALMLLLLASQLPMARVGRQTFDLAFTATADLAVAIIYYVHFL